MATDKTKNEIYDYRIEVKINKIAPMKYNPDQKGCICGIRVINSSHTSLEFSEQIGSKLFLIEFSTGEAIEIPEKHLSLAE